MGLPAPCRHPCSHGEITLTAKQATIAAALSGLLLLFHLVGSARATGASSPPGFGIIVGGGLGELGAEVRKVGFTSRRLEDGGRSGALTLMGETYRNGVPVEVLDPSLSRKDVTIEYQALYLELKRYFPLWGPAHVFWGLRGGATRITSTVARGPGAKDHTFQDDQIAPLWFLALPLALEHPGFLLLGFLEGGSAGLSWDLLPQHVWMEAQISAALVPRHRDKFVAIDVPFVVTRTITISASF